MKHFIASEKSLVRKGDFVQLLTNKEEDVLQVIRVYWNRFDRCWMAQCQTSMGKRNYKTSNLVKIVFESHPKYRNKQVA